MAEIKLYICLKKKTAVKLDTIGFHWAIPLGGRPRHFQDLPNLQGFICSTNEEVENVNVSGSRLCGDSDGMLVECLLHRRPLLGTLLLLVFITSRWEIIVVMNFVNTFDVQNFRGDHVKMIGTHHHAEVLTKLR